MQTVKKHESAFFVLMSLIIVGFIIMMIPQVFSFISSMSAAVYGSAATRSIQFLSFFILSVAIVLIMSVIKMGR